MFCENEQRIPDDMERKFLRILPPVCWAVLILMQITVVSCLEVHAEEEKTGYELPVRREVTYEDVEYAADIPQEIEAEVRDGTQDTTAVCHLEEVQELESRWVDGFSFPLTFHMYDADVFELGDLEIRKNEEGLQIDGYEEAFLELAGLSPEDYRITKAHWSGSPYTDEDGELCRDAVATGQKRVHTYRAVYSGTAVFAGKPADMDSEDPVIEETVLPAEETADMPAEPVFEERITESVAEPETEAKTGPAAEVPEVAVIAQEAAEPLLTAPSAVRVLWERIVRTLSYAVSLGGILVLTALLILTGFYMVKKLRLWYDHHKRKSPRRR